jgi:hypothetical protein
MNLEAVAVFINETERFMWRGANDADLTSEY